MIVLFALLLVGGGFVHPAQAQLQRVEQTIYGMDCAPCAHAMEQSLGAMEGVETVSVSLNDGLATIDLTNMNEVAYRDILKTISNGGFSAETATLEARGTLHQRGDRWILETPIGERYVLRAGGNGSVEEGRLQDLASDQEVIVTGQIPDSVSSEESHWPLRVRQVRPTT